MNEYELEMERAALWAEVCANNPGIDADAALRIASAELESLLAEAAAWDATAADMRLATEQPAPVALTA